MTARTPVTRRIWDRIRDQKVALTHTSRHIDPGDVIDVYDQRYRVTRLKQIGSTALHNGGQTPCWQIYGVPVED